MFEQTVEVELSESRLKGMTDARMQSGPLMSFCRDLFSANMTVPFEATVRVSCMNWQRSRFLGFALVV